MAPLSNRLLDPTDVFPGTITIGEVLTDYSDVVNEPHLLVTDVPTRQLGNQHFQILLDSDGLIGPDGKVIPMRTVVDTTADNTQVTAVVDTGFSLPQLPKWVS